MKRVDVRKRTIIRDGLSDTKIQTELSQRYASILDLPFEAIWYYPIIAVAYVQCCIILFELSDQINLHNENIIINVVYLIDVILMIIYKYIGNIQTSISSPSLRPLWIIYLELISAIPFYLLVSKNNNSKMFFCTKSLQLLKIVRIYYHFHRRHLEIQVGFLHRLFMLTLTLQFTYFFGFAFLYNTYKYLNMLDEVKDWFTIYVVFNQFSTWGLATLNHDVVLETTTLLLIICDVFIVKQILLSRIANDFLMTNRHRYFFKLKMKQISKELKFMKTPKFVVENVISYFGIIWDKYNGYRFADANLDYIPTGLQSEIMLDVSCMAFKHSNIFRNVNVNLVRYLSKLIQKKNYSKDDYIFEKGKIRCKMVYVLSGIIQIMSDQDTETPIISLSAGTCLGETTIFAPYECKSAVRCQNFVEVEELDLKAFSQLSIMQPETYRKLRKEIFNRYEEAKKMKNMACLFNENTESTRVTLIWIKYMLRKILKFDTQELENFYLNNEIADAKFDEMVFTTKYLDLLVLSTTIELNETAEFFTTTFPLILNPNGILLKFWNGMVFLLLIGTMILLPKYIFYTDDIPLLVMVIFRLTNYLFFFDIIIQIFTAVKTTETILLSPKQIFAYRSKSAGFFLDIIAALPMEIFACVAVAKKYGYGVISLRINKVFKIWKIWKIVNDIQHKYNLNLFHTFNFVSSIVFLYLIYCWSHLFYAFNCKYEPFDCTYNENYSTFFSATQYVTGIGIRGEVDDSHHSGFLGMLCYLSSSIFVAIMVMYVIAAYILQKTPFIYMETLKLELLNIGICYKISDNLMKRMFSYIDTQVNFDEGTKLIRGSLGIDDVQADNFKLIMEYRFSDQLKDLLFFKDLPESVLYNVCTHIKYTILPPNEVICYAGDVADTLIILSQGICEYISPYGSTLSHQPEILNPMVCTFDMPMTCTSVTKTHCLILSINYEKLRGILTQHFLYLFDVKMMQASLAEHKKILMSYLENDDTVYQLKEKITKSFVTFGYNLKEDTFEEYNYYVPFDRMSYGYLIKYILMRRTFHPNGAFMYYWELSRSTFAILTGLFYCCAITITSDNMYVIFIQTFLNIMAYIDIYVRFHVCYYNEIGILVTHPLETAKHYLCHSFSIDLYAVLPFNIILRPELLYSKILAFSNRLLQTYRYIGFVLYNQALITSTKTIFYCFLTLPPIFLVCVLLGSIVLSFYCEYGPNVPVNKEYFTEGVYCDTNSWIVNSNFEKPLTPIRVQFYGIYLVASIINAIGMQGFIINDYTIGMICTLLALLGFVYFLCVLARIALFFIRTSHDISFYQGILINLKTFMHIKKIDKFIQNYVFKYYEFKWTRERGSNICQVLDNFYYALKQDVLYDIYGDAILKESIFPKTSQKFIKNLILHTRHQTIMIDENILCVNDVNNKIYILYKGIVSVYAPDGTLLDTIGPGSIFGDLDGRGFVRQKVNIKSRTHVEVLILEGKVFFSKLELWPILYQKFKDVKKVNMHYIPSTNRSELLVEIQNRRRTKKKIRGIFRNIYDKFENAVFDPNSFIIYVWSCANLAVCYFSIFLYFYQIAVSEFTLLCTVSIYICDVVYIIFNFYLKEHLSYEDEKGIIIKDMVQIRKHFHKNKTYLINNLFHIPFDVIIFMFLFAENTRQMLFKIFRVNRLLRLFDIHNYYKRHSNTVSLTIYRREYVYLAITILLMFHIITCIIIFLSTFFEENMNINVPKNLYELSEIEKVKIYITYLYLVVSCITCIGTSTHTPEGTVLILTTIFLLILCPIIFSCVYSQIFVTMFKQNFLRKLFYDKLQVTEHYMKRQDLSSAIVNKTTRYIESLWLQHEGVLRPYLLYLAPDYLRETINCAAYSFHINNHFVFGKCHVDFKRQLCNFLDFDLYYPGDYVTFKNNMNSTMYIIRKGEIEVVDEDEHWNETHVKILTACHSFGVEQGLYPMKAQQYSYKAKRYSVVLFLKFEKWRHLLRLFPASANIIYNTMRE